MAEKKKFYLIDGHSYIHRAFHALPPLSNSRGQMVNAIYGFIRMLLKILNNYQPDYIAVCFDSPTPTFRHKEFEQYKATRKEAPLELKSQIPLAKESVKAFNIISFEMPGYEADDIIATLAKKAEEENIEVIIVTGDKDTLQLIDENIKVLNEPKNLLFDERTVKEKFGFGPEFVVDYLGLCGDTSDNIPGVPGIGEKTATKLVQDFGRIENLYQNLDKVPGKLKEKLQENQQLALESKRLVTLIKNVPLEKDIDACQKQDLNRERLLSFLQEFEFKTLIAQLITREDETDIDYRIMVEEKELDNVISQITAKKEVSLHLVSDQTGPGQAAPLLLRCYIGEGGQAKIIGIGLSLKPKEAHYLPVGHDGSWSFPTCHPEERSDEACLTGRQGSHEILQLFELQDESSGKNKKKNSPTAHLGVGQLLLQKLTPILEDEKIKKYGHNTKFSIRVFANNGINLRGIYFDTMIASYLLNPSKANQNLEDIALEYLNFKMLDVAELLEGNKKLTLDQIVIEKVSNFACVQADVIGRLVEILEAKLKEKDLAQLFYDVEIPLMEILAEMEEEGILVDLPYLAKLSTEFQNTLTNLERKIYEIAGTEFNIKSPKQLAFVLFEKLQLPVIERTKTGPSTAESVLRQLSLMHDLPKKIIEYRELQKLKSTYIEPIPELVNPKTGRLHTSFNQTVTATGRLSSSEPNLQNIPIRTELGRSIRRAFIPKQGCIFLSADYSQIDLRVLAHVSGDENMRRAFLNGEDIHTHTACEIFGIIPKEVDSEKRRVAKTVNFGLSYGMSPYGLSQSLGIDTTTAKEYIDKYFVRYQGVKNYMEKIIQQARTDGYVTTLLNRRRYLPDIESKDNNMRSFAERVAINMPIQGTAADIIKVAMIKLSRKLKASGFSTKMLLQIHDELLFEVPQNELDKVKNLIKKEMEQAIKLDVPVVVDLSIGKNWRDLEAI